MFSCDYNGWADVPEEEREELEAFEAAQALPRAPVYMALVVEPPVIRRPDLLEGRAA